ncbi:hypothetical protein IWQ55_001344 [Labrenzia sp. EL_208]|nr:hypothetical protein [Labrenzia sp. EL_132]MBG6228146.1 hypothetical protein [Labrenzia sp. EL_208]
MTKRWNAGKLHDRDIEDSLFKKWDKLAWTANSGYVSQMNATSIRLK